VDIVTEVRGETIPFEVKYSGKRVGPGDVKGLIEFCTEKNLDRGYVITKELSDFETLTDHTATSAILKIPAALACYWLSLESPP
jgi:uncharacterized protein